MAISLTAAAAKHVTDMLTQRGRGIGLRLGTKKSGCTGFAYVVDYADRIEAGDHVFDSDGVKVIVDDRSLPLLNGTEIHFGQSNLLNSGFEFRNPNVRDQCGCGESFST
jgi:iron-sulfur cluster assembly protein